MQGGYGTCRFQSSAPRSPGNQGALARPQRGPAWPSQASHLSRVPWPEAANPSHTLAPTASHAGHHPNTSASPARRPDKRLGNTTGGGRVGPRPAPRCIAWLPPQTPRACRVCCLRDDNSPPLRTAAGGRGPPQPPPPPARRPRVRSPRPRRRGRRPRPCALRRRTAPASRPRAMPCDGAERASIARPHQAAKNRLALPPPCAAQAAGCCAAPGLSSASRGPRQHSEPERARAGQQESSQQPSFCGVLRCRRLSLWKATPVTNTPASKYSQWDFPKGFAPNYTAERT